LKFVTFKCYLTDKHHCSRESLLTDYKSRLSSETELITQCHCVSVAWR